jgi:hypothetical protein
MDYNIQATECPEIIILFANLLIYILYWVGKIIKKVMINNNWKKKKIVTIPSSKISEVATPTLEDSLTLIS